MKHVLALACCALVAGCPTRGNPLFCDGDARCSDPERPFCDLSGNESGVANTCIESPFAGACNAATPCTGESKPHCSPEGECVECASNEHCPAGAPVCGADNACSGCDAEADGDGLCSSRFEDAPYCLSSGGCAACRISDHCTTERAPFCDESGACVACSDHEQCASGFCEGDGSCADAASLIFVDASAGADEAGCGTSDEPCATVAAGLAGIDAERRIVVLRGGVYPERLVITDLVATIVGLDDAELQPATASEQFGLEVLGSSEVTLDSVAVSHSSVAGNGAVACIRTGDDVPSLTVRDATINASIGVALRSDDCALTMTDSSLQQGNGGGIVVIEGSAVIDGCRVLDFDDIGVDVVDSDLVLTRSTLQLNLSGGLRLEDSTFRIENNFIVGNGSVAAGGSRFGGALIESSATAGPQLFRFNTLADNSAGDLDPADTTGVRVVGGAATCSSNIVWDGFGGMAHVSGTCAWTHSIVQGGVAGGTKIEDVDPQFVGPTDYHLKGGSPAIDSAQSVGAVTLDFDGDERPAGTGHDIGADERD